ncbi:MAG TPA: penicillin-binding protein 2 [Candidatus Nanoarchaeia archaeon]|nr:penicillin-binding protein 2 [Candidatus Nanoarchaeia archaeon]
MIQVVSGEEYALKADRQYLTSNSSLLNRGTIYFTSKEGDRVTAAYQETGNIIVINPKQIVDKNAIYNEINSHLPIEWEEFEKKAGKVNDPYEEVAKKVDADIGVKIQEARLPGLQVYKQKWRSYPGNELAAATIGFMAYDHEELEGRYGLEYQYEDTLKRSDESSYANFFVEVFSNIKEQFSEGEKAEGDIITTIEPNVQTYLEQVLKDINDTWSSDFTAGIVMNPDTGEIIGMGQYPTFDPNNFTNVKDAKVFSNHLVQNVHEMGSIIKPLTVAAGIDAGAITPRTTYDDKGFLVLNGKRISNYDGKGRGIVDMQQVLNQSLNTGVAFIVQKMGNDVFTQYFRNFGLDRKTGIDFPFEAAPLVDNLKSTRDIEHATASYGQGIAMTPISTIRALATLANGGKLVNPHLVSQINYKSGLHKTIDPGQPAQIIKKETADEVTKMLINVVDDALLKGTAKLEHYSVAAKTGTAQIANPNGGGYYDDRYLHSFFGYFPAYNPKFIVFLYTYYPKDVQYASETLTTSFFELTKYLINYYDIPPDR